MTENTVTISIATYEALKDNQMYFEANLEQRCREYQNTFDKWKEEYKTGCKIAMVIKETSSGGIKEIEINEVWRVEKVLKHGLITEIRQLRNQCEIGDQPIEDKWYTPLLNLFK